MKSKTLSPASLKSLWRSIEHHILSEMGHVVVSDVQPAHMLAFFRRLEALGIHSMSSKLRRALTEAFDLAAFSESKQTLSVGSKSLLSRLSLIVTLTLLMPSCRT